MRILNAQASCFSSYDSIHFDFTNQGLALISGPTGSGKSTLCDLIPWVLFGKTAKNGSVDDVRSWGSKDETTWGKLSVWIDGTVLEITRIRGSSNDLYYNIHGDANFTRGKDLKDTQSQINRLVGVDADLYMLGAYYNEFSPLTGFFTANAKTRRSIIEQLVDLSLASTIAEDAGAYRKELRDEIKRLLLEISSLNYTLTESTSSLEYALANSATWKAKNAKAIKLASFQQVKFDEIKAEVLAQMTADNLNSVQALQSEIDELRAVPAPDLALKERLIEGIKDLNTAICAECGSPKDSSKKMALTKQVNLIDQVAYTKSQAEVQINRLERQIERLTKDFNRTASIKEAEENTWGERVAQLQNEVDPYIEQQSLYKTRIEKSKAAIQDKEAELRDFNLECSDIETLLTSTEVFRNVLSENTVQGLQNATNSLLSTYFDAEVKVLFTSETADKIELTIYKDANECSYAQLSKGQRQLLKLCFAVATMQHIENHHGVSFSTVFLDEALDGLDDELKIKAFGLLQFISTAHESVFVVDHNSELKTRFSSRYEIQLIDGWSHYEKA